ncbi:hypothetical protein [Calidifontibacillus erzurumensis]
MIRTNKYYKLKYKRGFLLTDFETSAPHEHWNYMKIGKYHLYYDPLNEVFFDTTNDQWVLLLGTMIDIRSGTTDKQFIASELLKYLISSEVDFFDYLDELSGRYLIFYGNNQTASILSDATGLRSIFYSTKQTVISSHCLLVNEITHSNESPYVDKEWFSKYSSSQLPGHFTIYEDIYFLTPNTLLEVNEKKIRRFFPRENLEILPVERVVEEISEITKKQLYLLSKINEKFLFSLTAGLDSRTSLALTKDYKDSFHYFTYIKENFNSDKLNAYIIDQKIVTEMVYNLGLKHDFLTIDYNLKNQDFNEFLEVVKCNTTSQHNVRLAKLYFDQFPSNILHIRSNVYEIGRMYYRKNHKLPKTATMKSLAECYSKQAKDDEKVKEAFQKYYDLIQMDKIYNYDPFDILYWEYRMGTWISQVLLESDIAHDTFILFNVRKILKLLLSVSYTDKYEYTVFHELINKNWPILNYWEINSLGNPTAFYDKQFDEVGIPLTATRFTSGSLLNNRTVPIRKKVQTRRFKFNLEESNPKNGDYAEADIPLKTELNKSSHCIIHLRSPYENIKLKGRIKYQIYLNNQLLLEEDISCWKETNQISIKWKAVEPKNRLKIRIQSIKDCEDWSWGKAGMILVEKIILRNGDNLDSNNIQVTATSPFSVIINK